MEADGWVQRRLRAPAEPPDDAWMLINGATDGHILTKNETL